jgi:predicted phage terminase large subunit-like protein
MKKTELSDRQLLDMIIRNDFPMFVELAFGVVYPDSEWNANWHIVCLAWRLQQMADGKVDPRLVVNMPPRSLKTFIVSVCFPAWLLVRDPTIPIIVATYSDDLSKKSARDFAALIQSPLVFRLSRGRLSNPRKFTESEFETAKGGGRLATSVGGTLTGRGGDVLIIDDTLKADDAASEAKRTSVNNWFNDTLHSRRNRPGKSLMIVCMQRLHADDLAGNLIEQNWPSLVMPSIAVERTEYDIGDEKPLVREAGDPLQPARDDLNELAKTKKQIGSYAFSAQYQQTPEPATGNMIKREWLGSYSLAPSRNQFSQIYLVCDPAGKAGTHNDYTAIVVVGIVKREIYVLEVRRGHWNALRIKSEIESLAREHGATRVIIETTGMGEGIRQEIERESRFDIIGTQPKDDKVTRVSRVITRFELGHVRLPENADWMSDFKSEILSFPSGRYDDQLDALVMILEDLADHDSDNDFSDIRIDTQTFWRPCPYAILDARW